MRKSLALVLGGLLCATLLGCPNNTNPDPEVPSLADAMTAFMTGNSLADATADLEASFWAAVDEDGLDAAVGALDAALAGTVGSAADVVRLWHRSAQLAPVVVVPTTSTKASGDTAVMYVGGPWQTFPAFLAALGAVRDAFSANSTMTVVGLWNPPLDIQDQIDIEGGVVSPAIAQYILSSTWLAQSNTEFTTLCAAGSIARTTAEGVVGTSLTGVGTSVPLLAATKAYAQELLTFDICSSPFDPGSCTAFTSELADAIQAKRVAGKKVLILAHSQGNFFVRSVYSQLTASDTIATRVIELGSPSDLMAFKSVRVDLCSDTIAAVSPRYGLCSCYADPAQSDLGHALVDSYLTGLPLNAILTFAAGLRGEMRTGVTYELPCDWGVTLQFGTGSTTAGDTVTIPVTIEATTLPSTLQFDIVYNSAKVELQSIEAGPSATDANKVVSGASHPPGLVRVLVVGLNMNAMEPGVVMNLVWRVLDTAAAGDVIAIQGASPSAASPLSETIPITTADGQITVIP